MTHDREAHPTEGVNNENDVGAQIEKALNGPLSILSLVMLVLMIVGFAAPLDQDEKRQIVLAIALIWWVFVLEFALEVFLSKNRLGYLKKHWFEAVLIVAPVLRVFWIFRAVQSFRMIGALRATAAAPALLAAKRASRGFLDAMSRHGLPYMFALTVVVVLIGSLGMYLIERDAHGAVMRTFGDATWWTIGTVTTVGTELYPVTGEGRFMATLLMIYGVSIFGYIAGVLASYFVRADRSRPRGSAERPDERHTG